MNWTNCPVIESDPDRHSGDWVFKDTRLPVSIVVEALSRGLTVDDLIDQYSINPEQLKDFLQFVAASLEQEKPVHAHSV
jgi:uncharacterized protein (DUF433 family)